MHNKLNTLPRLVVCSAIAGALVFALFGCAKKDAEQAQTTTEDMPTEDIAAMPAMMPAAVGTYVIAVGEDDAGQTITVMLHEDNTAMVTVEYMNGQPTVTQNGNWAMGEDEGVINFMYGGEGSTMVIPMMIDGDNLHLGGDMAGAVGVEELVLVRQGAMDPMDH